MTTDALMRVPEGIRTAHDPGATRTLLDGGLATPGLYAVAVRTTAGRGPVVVRALVAAFAAGRRATLATRLDPAGDDFRRLVEPVDGSDGLREALADGRLRLLVADGDYAVHLFLRGAAGYVQELEQFGVGRGELVVIDGADDLYTPHDRAALLAQARTYRDWCSAGGRTMLQVHLSTGASRPLLDGDQAALHHLDGAARVVAAPAGVLLQADHWQAAGTDWSGFEEDLRPSPGRTSVAAAAGLAAVDAARRTPLGARWRLWYVGPPDPALLGLGDRFRWRVLPDLAPLAVWSGQRRGMCVLVSLPERAVLRDVARQLAAVRAALGPLPRIGVREPAQRLRDYTERRLLLTCGADVVVPHGTPLEDFVRATVGAHDAGPRVAMVGPAGVAAGPGAVVVDLDEAEDGPWLPPDRFLGRALDRVARCRDGDVPCALVEIEDASVPAAVPVWQAGSMLRPEDVATIEGQAARFLLFGCREFDALDVVRRLAADGRVPAATALQIRTGTDAVAQRLADLARAGLAPVAAHTPAVGPAARSGRKRDRASRRLVASLALAVAGTLAAGLAPQAAQARDAAPAAAVPGDADAFSAAYAAGRYAEAARLGRERLDRDPGDDAARLRWANALAWSGDTAGARDQYRQLLGTRSANAGRVGLGYLHLWDGRPMRALAWFREAIAADPTDAAARRAEAEALDRTRPTTSLRRLAMDDSTGARRAGWQATHRWHDAARDQAFEVGAQFGTEDRPGAVRDQSPRTLSATYEHARLPGSPRITLAHQSAPVDRSFVDLGVRDAEERFTLSVGRVNWGELAFDPRALAAGLVADRIGVGLRLDTPLGELAAGARRFVISDGNRIDDAQARLTPAWQPLAATAGLRWFVAGASRSAERADPRYWSPVAGHVTGELGLAWSRWEGLSGGGVELRRIAGLGGEGAAGWAGSASARWAVDDGWALQVEASRGSTARAGSRYGASSLGLTLVRQWP